MYFSSALPLRVCKTYIILIFCLFFWVSVKCTRNNNNNNSGKEKKKKNKNNKNTSEKAQQDQKGRKIKIFIQHNVIRDSEKDYLIISRVKNKKLDAHVKVHPCVSGGIRSVIVKCAVQ